MATSVGSSAAFTFGNMKPAPDEEIDALWGQNVADNTGFLRSQRMPFINTYGTNYIATVSGGPIDFHTDMSSYVHLTRISGHNRLVGTIRGDGTFNDQSSAPDCYATHGVIFYGDLATFTATTGFATANIGGPFTYCSTFAFEISLDSYLSVGSWGTLRAMFSGSCFDASNGAPGFGTNRAIVYTYGTPAKVYTTWAN